MQSQDPGVCPHLSVVGTSAPVLCLLCTFQSAHLSQRICPSGALQVVVSGWECMVNGSLGGSPSPFLPPGLCFSAVFRILWELSCNPHPYDSTPAISGVTMQAHSSRHPGPEVQNLLEFPKTISPHQFLPTALIICQLGAFQDCNPRYPVAWCPHRALRRPKGCISGGFLPGTRPTLAWFPQHHQERKAFEP